MSSLYSFLVSLVLSVGVHSGPVSTSLNSYDLSVGAFEATSHSVILWTHVTSSEEDASIIMRLEVAKDDAFRNIIKRKIVFALPERDHTVRSVVGFLRPSTQYYYRFSSLGPNRITSDTGTFRTLPSIGSQNNPIKFVMSGDTNIAARYVNPERTFYVLKHAADQNPDFFIYFGDTVYADTGGLPGGPAETLDEYRQIHRNTRADVDLQHILRNTVTYSGWDDHEVFSDYAKEAIDPARFENGARAFFEYLPIRNQFTNEKYRTYRKVRLGKDVEIFLLDLRQYRTSSEQCLVPPGVPATDGGNFSPFTDDEQIIFALGSLGVPGVLEWFLTPPPAGLGIAGYLVALNDATCAAEFANPNRTMLGQEQFDWLKNGLENSDATWKIVVTGPAVAKRKTLGVHDAWEAYAYERQQLLDFLKNLNSDTPIVLLGTDIHANLATKLADDKVVEVITGPIGTTSTEGSIFQGGIAQLLLLNGVPPVAIPSLLPDENVFENIIRALFDVANGGVVSQGSPAAHPPYGTIFDKTLGYENDAYSYALFETHYENNVPHLTVRVMGDRNYDVGTNSPSDVEELFSFTLTPFSAP